MRQPTPRALAPEGPRIRTVLRPAGLPLVCTVMPGTASSFLRTLEPVWRAALSVLMLATAPVQKLTWWAVEPRLDWLSRPIGKARVPAPGRSQEPTGFQSPNRLAADAES